MPHLFDCLRRSTPAAHHRNYPADVQREVDAQLSGGRRRRVRTTPAQGRRMSESSDGGSVGNTRLLERMAKGWANFCDRVTIAWKKLCLNCCCANSRRDRRQLEREIAKLEHEINRRNGVSSARDRLEDAEDALREGDVVGAIDAGARAAGHAIKAAFHDAHID